MRRRRDNFVHIAECCCLGCDPWQGGPPPSRRERMGQAIRAIPTVLREAIAARFAVGATRFRKLPF